MSLHKEYQDAYDQYRRENPTHTYLVHDLISGETVRQDAADGLSAILAINPDPPGYLKVTHVYSDEEMKAICDSQSNVIPRGLGKAPPLPPRTIAISREISERWLRDRETGVLLACPNPDATAEEICERVRAWAGGDDYALDYHRPMGIPDARCESNPLG